MTIKQRVENILRVSKTARNSDDDLQIIYMQKSGMKLSNEQIKLFKDLPKMETLRRIRQKLQEEGKYLADSEVEKERYQRFKATRSSISRSTSDEIEQIITGDKEYKVMAWGE